MVRERIADDIYVFTSRQYARVTAGAVITGEGVILIDTLYFPEETKAIKEFLQDRQGYKIRYVVNTHYHADHTQGTYLFPDARVVSHGLCRRLLDTAGRQGLAEAKLEAAVPDEVEIILPDLVFEEGNLDIQLGGKTLRLYHMPGHSPDLIGVLVIDNQILFASDNLMPVPTFFDGDYEDLVRSLQTILALEPDSMVQGHGEVILRGEVETTVHGDLEYLRTIKEAVAEIIRKGQPAAALQDISIESCGKSRIPLNGLVTDLHQANLRKLYQELNSK
jgi:glyoxylase-like metal-dependent hydrolase (beta-lactamase superfamily II)